MRAARPRSDACCPSHSPSISATAAASSGRSASCWYQVRPIQSARYSGRKFTTQQRARSLGGAGQRRHEGLAGRVDPVQVLEDHDDGLLAAPRQREAAHHVEDAPLPHLGAHGRRRALRVRHAEEVEAAAGSRRAGSSSTSTTAPAIFWRASRSESRGPMPKAWRSRSRTGRKAIALPCATPQAWRTSTPCARQCSMNSWQSRLLPVPASATTPTTPPCPARARSSAASRARQLGVAPHELREAARARGVEPRARLAEALELVHAHRLRDALERRDAEVAQREPAADEPRGAVADADGARLGERSMRCARPTVWPCAV